MEKNIDWEKLTKILGGEMSSEQLTTEEAEQLQQLKSLWGEAGKASREATPPTSIAVAKERMWARIEQEQKTDTLPASGNTRKLWPYIAVAASLVLPILLYFSWPSEQPNAFQGQLSFATEKGGDKQVKLPDGSVVLLQEGTLSYTFDHERQQRKAVLAGKAFFEVEHQPQYPFVVEMSEASVEVLGTSFQLESSTKEQVALSVSTGKVAFRAPGIGGQVLAIAGQQVVYLPKEQKTKKILGDNYISVKNGYIAYDATLAELVAFIADWSGQDVVIDKGIEELSLTSTQGVLYKSPQHFFEQAVSPIADMVTVAADAGNIAIKQN